MMPDNSDVPRREDEEAEDELETRVRRPSQPAPRSERDTSSLNPPAQPTGDQPPIRAWMPPVAGETPGAPRRPSPPPEPPPTRAAPRAESRPPARPPTTEQLPEYRPAAERRYRDDNPEDAMPPRYATGGGYERSSANEQRPDTGRYRDPAQDEQRYRDELAVYGGATGYAERPAPRVAGGNNACIWVAGLVVVIVVACGLLAYGAITSGFAGLSGFVPRAPSLPMITPTIIIETNRPSVIEQIRPMGRLESVQYTIEKVIPGESTGPLPPLTADRILFVAHGEVIAGVDLGKMTSSDVRVEGNTVTITLPAAEILVSRLDNDKSYVYDRETGFFTKADPNLESHVREVAENEIVKAALEDGILLKAQQNAEDTLRTLILGLGYEEVNFRTRGGGSTLPTATP